MTARNIIFIAGIHGVGKTQLCNEICNRLKIEYVNAGELIRRSKREEATIRKKVGNIHQNQEALILALDDYLKADIFYLLDGHFCLIKEGDKIEKIPASVFEQINPLAVVLLKDNIDAIKGRLAKRDQFNYEFDLLRDLQNIEIEHAENICKIYNLPLLIKNPFVAQERAEIVEFVKGQVSK